MGSSKHLRAGAFFRMSPALRSGHPGFEIENIDKLLQGRPFLTPPIGCRGFREYPEPPLVRIDKKLGRPPRDVETFHDYWLVSKRFKDAAEAIDIEAFSFLKCNVVATGSASASEYWLCDVVLTLDAVDEDRSHIIITTRSIVGKLYKIMPGAILSIRSEVVDNFSIFRLKYAPHWVVCNKMFATAFEGAAVEGCMFESISG